MLITINSVSGKKNFEKYSSDAKKSKSILSKSVCDSVSFKAQPLSVKQALKFLFTASLGGLGIISFLPNILLKKIYKIEMEEYAYELNRLYGQSRQEEIDAQVSDINQIIEQHPDKLKIMESLLRKNVFNSLGKLQYLAPEDSKLFNKQLEFLTKMANDEKFVRCINTEIVYNQKSNRLYSEEDIDAKEKILDYIQDFNQKYEASEQWQEDKLNTGTWSIGRNQVSIINVTNAFNKDIILEMLKLKTTYNDSLCPSNEIKAAELSVIGSNVNEQNIDYIKKILCDKNISKQSIAEILKNLQNNKTAKLTVN